MLTYQLISKQIFQPDEPINIQFILFNQSDKPIYVLKWYTPLEGVEGEIFNVYRDGNELMYNGRMIKRGEPRPEDYIRIEAKSNVSSTIDLSLYYDINKPGKYKIEFYKKISDMIITEDLDHNKGTFPRPIEKHKAIEIDGNSIEIIVN